MPKRRRSVARSSVRKSKELSPIMQFGVVFIIVAAILLAVYVGKNFF